ncbi:MAG TPA: hypothetical protein VNQ90_15470, partial [Chthoniobacteraceae bacterium]|nr:hypothetical protein [Chthoniobacteraceae bacterium]
ANLSRANLSRANLYAIKGDFFEILLNAPAEVAGLKAALIAGEVDGSTYFGDCCCLVGTLARVSGVAHDDIPGITPDASRPAERWFLAIRKGNTPENNAVAKLTLEWIEEFQAKIGHAVKVHQPKEA